FQLKSDSLPHAHAQTTKTFYKHQDSRIMKAQELKTKTSAQTLIYKIFLQRYQVYQGRLLASFQDDAKYEHVGQDTRSQGDIGFRQGIGPGEDNRLGELSSLNFLITVLVLDSAIEDKWTWALEDLEGGGDGEDLLYTSLALPLTGVFAHEKW
ncbi:hypothetical protein Tco_0725913, partial [Tanacetum coccineum]